MDQPYRLRFDPSNGNIIAVGRSFLQFLGKDGRRIAETKLEQADSVYDLEAFPQGDRCLTLSASSLRIYDLKPDRIQID